MALEQSEIMLLESIQRDAREAREAATKCQTSIATLDARSLDHDRDAIALQQEVRALRTSFDEQLVEVRKEARSASTKIGAPIAGLGIFISMIRDALTGGG